MSTHRIEKLRSDLAAVEELQPEPLSLDELLFKQNVFSARATNALVRQGIITLRLLLDHTAALLLSSVPNLGEKTLSEIEQTLAIHGLRLAPEVRELDAFLTRLLTRIFHHRAVSRPLDRRTLIKKINKVNRKNRYTRAKWSMAEVAAGADAHPYIHKLDDGRYVFEIRPPADENSNPTPTSVSVQDIVPHGLSTTSPDVPANENKRDPAENIAAQLAEGKNEEVIEPPAQTVLEDTTTLDLSTLWSAWLGQLNERQRTILNMLYGIEGDEPHTLQEVGEALDITRERVRQIKSKALRQIKWIKWPYWNPMEKAFTQCMQQAHNILAPREWEQWLDEHASWDLEEPRPVLFHLLCDLFSEVHYVSQYGVATKARIDAGHLAKLDSAVKRILRRCKGTGLTANELVAAVQEQRNPELPGEMFEPQFILKAVDQFERVGLGRDNRYTYLRKRKKSLYPIAASGWTGKPGTKLYKWEQKLRAQFETVDWIGQLAVTEADFRDLCQSIQSEAQAPNYFSKVVEGQPRLVPPAVFMTTMVFSARYADYLPQEAIDEFWAPYLRTVWNTEYSQTFYTKCKKRFNAVVQFLENEYNFVFPRAAASREVVTPVFRHALIPRYMQSDFADWLRKNWRSILHLAETPALLAVNLQNEPSLEGGNYSHRLSQFIKGKSTQETAISLITTMAAAISMHVNEGESVESISNLLADSPIEQEIWQELAGIFDSIREGEPAPGRVARPRLTWTWAVDEGEMGLRVQNVVLPAENDLSGEPDRLVWLESPDSDPLDAEIEIAVSPWRMKSGERIIPDLFVSEPDGPPGGELVLLTDMDEVAMRLDAPPQPTDSIQFFRITQQGAYGIPIDIAQIRDGAYLVCAEEPVTFREKGSEDAIDPDFEMHVPYPLDEQYNWAAQITLNLPAVAAQGSRQIELVPSTSSQTSTGIPSLVGEKPVRGLSRQIQPTFANTQVALHLEGSAGDLPKQAALWLHGQDGWRWHRTSAELRQQGHLVETEEGLRVDLNPFLPNRPNFYTLELRVGLQPSLPAPLQFAVIPDLSVELLSNEPIYTPATPFKILLRGVESSVIVRSSGISVDILDDRSQQVTWRDYRHDPQLLLRFEKVEIPLAWSVPQFMAWLERQLPKPYLTLQEMRETTLHALSRHADVSRFGLSLSGQTSRTFPLRRNRAHIQLGHSQLYDMVKLSNDRRTVVNVLVNGAEWPLLEVRRQPRLPGIRVCYHDAEQHVHISTGLDEEWPGNVRFVVQSVTNPFEKNKTLGSTSRLMAHHCVPASLAEGIYLLQIELDGALLPLDEEQMSFTVGASFDVTEQSQDLIAEIRSGSLISAHHAEDFVLWWAELASTEAFELTTTTLYQLSTIPIQALENFTHAHLEALWSPLAALKEVSQPSAWAEKHGLLPAWIFLTDPLIFKTLDRGHRLRVYPIQVLARGFWGKGYGRWRLSPGDNGPKEFVYVQWKPVSETTVQIEAGLPEEIPDDWASIDLLDTYSLHCCARCGRLTGARSFTLPKEIQEAHRHGQGPLDLHDINTPEAHGGYQLIAELFPDRREESLIETYEAFHVLTPSGADCLPEPATDVNDALLHGSRWEQLAVILRELLWYGADGKETSVWAGAQRLISRWSREGCVSRFGQLAVGLGLLLRLAAIHPQVYHRLLKRANLSEMDIQTLLAEVYESAPAHVAWGLTWAELLIQHNAGPVG